MGLKDFQKSTDEFNFRFWRNGQVIEITKDSSTINGVITNYIFHTKNTDRNKKETLTSKMFLSSEQIEKIYTLIKVSGILNLPSDENIENWNNGNDGIAYVIEQADKNNYWLKSYWSPSSQDSIPEALIVLNVINGFETILNLKEMYSTFRKSLPKKGCYNSGGRTNVYYISNSFELGYSGATKLPLGFSASYSASYIGKVKVNSGVALQYNFSNNEFHHLNFQASKWNIFFTRSTLSDFVTYSYQDRKLNTNKLENRYQNHQLKYGLNLKKNIGFGVGLDYLATEHKRVGAHLYAYKWFSIPNISTILSSSVFNNQINYKAELIKSFNLNSKFSIRRIDLRLAYEDFMDYKDLYIGIGLLF